MTTDYSACSACGHPKSDHEWSFPPFAVEARMTLGQCHHRGDIPAADCHCATYEAPPSAAEIGRAERLAAGIVASDPAEHARDVDADRRRRYALTTAEPAHYHRYDRGHVECNLTPPCHREFRAAEWPPQQWATTTFSPEDIASWPEMQELARVAGFDLRPGAEVLCGCGHPRSAHIYEDGPCRPGYVCEHACTRFELLDDAGGDRGAPDAPKISEHALNEQRLHTCWCGHSRAEHVVPAGWPQMIGSCRHDKFTDDACGCEQYELADDAADLIENLCDLIDKWDGMLNRRGVSHWTPDDEDLMRRARRWLDQQPEPPRPVFDPHDFGAVGDGVHDDGPAIRATIAAAAAANGTVAFGVGAYLMHNEGAREDSRR